MTDYYVLHSGGLDSTAALALVTKRPDARNVVAVGVNYGQRHVKELVAAEAIRAELAVESATLDLTGYGQSVTSALTSDIDVPEGHYADDNMAVTVVPGRNAVMLSAVAGLAASRSTNHPAVVVTAVHAGDHTVYADCRPEFVDAIDAALRAGCGVSVEAPFVNVTKTDIARIGYENNSPAHLTWSCYKGSEKHCGRCGTCVERREAFTDAGLVDPTDYETGAN